MCPPPDGGMWIQLQQEARAKMQLEQMMKKENMKNERQLKDK